MPVEKGRDWGQPEPLPGHGVVVASDAAAAEVVEQARRAGEDTLPPLGLTGGDLCRTLGGTGDEARLRSAEATAFDVDLGAVLVDGRLFFFVAHVVARSRLWRRTIAAMNAEFLGRWDVAPRAHPGDGQLDIVDARLLASDLLPVRSRLATGSYLPHPRITVRRVPAAQFGLDPPLKVRLDGRSLGAARNLAIRLEPAALRVHI